MPVRIKDTLWEREAHSFLLKIVENQLRTRWKERWKKYHDGSEFSIKQRELDVGTIRMMVKIVRWLRKVSR